MYVETPRAQDQHRVPSRPALAARHAFAILGTEREDPDRVAVEKLEVVLAARHQADGRHAELFLNLADRAVAGGFTGFETPTGCDDLARTQAALLADEQHLAVSDHEAEGGELAGLPALPVDLGNRVRHVGHGVSWVGSR